MADLPVGRIIRSSTQRYAVGCQVLRPEVPSFGALVKVKALNAEVYGLIYDVRMEDDPFVRQVAATDDPYARQAESDVDRSVPAEVIEDQRLRKVPIEVQVLVVGFGRDGGIEYRLPPQPPLSLDVIYACDGPEFVEFTSRFDYFRLVLDNRDLPADELLAANLRQAAAADSRRGGDYLVEAGRELARLLAQDLPRLDAMLRRLQP
ncbi:MAG: hypothetical protein JXA93_16175 [Anaerolineae bacterium]|nr:hypothetical protein [Anaerolineae bacterium]